MHVEGSGVGGGGCEGGERLWKGVEGGVVWPGVEGEGGDWGVHYWPPHECRWEWMGMGGVVRG